MYSRIGIVVAQQALKTRQNEESVVNGEVGSMAGRRRTRRPNVDDMIENIGEAGSFTDRTHSRRARICENCAQQNMDNMDDMAENIVEEEYVARRTRTLRLRRNCQENMDDKINLEITPLLIHLVKRQPSLWDTTDANYGSLKKKADDWAIVCREIGLSVDVIKKKWKNIRDSFVKSESNGHCYKYADSLQFLKQHIRQNKLNEEEAEEERSRVSVLQCLQLVTADIRNVPTPNRPAFTQEVKKMTKKFMGQRKDENQMWL